MKSKIGELKGNPIVVVSTPNEILKHEIAIEIDNTTNKVKSLKQRDGDQLMSLLDVPQEGNTTFSADVLCSYDDGSTYKRNIALFDVTNNKCLLATSGDTSDKVYSNIKTLDITNLPSNLNFTGKSGAQSQYQVIFNFNILNKKDEVIDFFDNILGINSSDTVSSNLTDSKLTLIFNESPATLKITE